MNCAGVIQWQNGSFPSSIRGFDSPRPLFLIFLLLAGGCATAHHANTTALPTLPPQQPSAYSAPSAAETYHDVGPKQTLWSISRQYGVDVETLARANHLSNTSQIQAGQRLLIPERSRAARRAKPSVAVAPVRSSGPIPVDGREFIWPVQGGRVIAPFGTRQQGVANQGIDLSAPAGAPVVAARGGRVTFVGEELPGYGKTVILDHGDGYSTVYAWNRDILVSVGQVVPQRFTIATVGTTGRTQAPALHFQIRRGHRPQNPFYFLP